MITDKPKPLPDTVRALLTAALARGDHLIHYPVYMGGNWFTARLPGAALIGQAVEILSLSLVLRIGEHIRMRGGSFCPAHVKIRRDRNAGGRPVRPGGIRSPAARGVRRRFRHV
jgi:hypothetical protein